VVRGRSVAVYVYNILWKTELHHPILRCPYMQYPSFITLHPHSGILSLLSIIYDLRSKNQLARFGGVFCPFSCTAANGLPLVPNQQTQSKTQGTFERHGTDTYPFTLIFSTPPPPRRGFAIRPCKNPPIPAIPPEEGFAARATRACSSRSRTSWSCCSNLWFWDVKLSCAS